MGEEEKKVAEEAEKAAEEKGVKKEEAPPEKKEAPLEDVKKDEKKSEEAPAPPPPPREIVLKVFMHCEGCARKVRRCLKGFEGVEDVITDCRASKVVVKGEKAHAVKVLERVQRKSHRKVELISPIPEPPSPDKPPEAEVVKSDDKKEEAAPVINTVVLRVYMHCDACAQEIKRRIQKMKGVESAEPDLKGSQVTVKGVLEPQKLVDYVYKRTGKHSVILKVEPEKEEPKAEESKEAKEEKKAEAGGEAKKEEEVAKENKEGSGGGGDAGSKEPAAKPDVAQAEGEESKLELRKNEMYYYHPHPQNYYQMYPQRFVQEEMNAYPPQMFSDENPNACSIM